MLSTNQPLNLTDAEQALIRVIRRAGYAKITELVVIEGQPFAVKLTQIEQRLDLSKADVRTELLALEEHLDVPIDFSRSATEIAVDSEENPENPAESDNSSENQPS